MAALAPGAQAPADTLPSLDGKKLSIPGPAKLTLLAIFKASCPTCRWALPFVQSLHEKAGGGALSVVGIAEDDAEKARELADELGLTFPIATESEPWATSAAYGLETVPTLFLVDGSGKILMTSAGFARDDLRDVAAKAAALDGRDAIDPFPEGEEIPAFRPG